MRRLRTLAVARAVLMGNGSFPERTLCVGSMALFGREGKPSASAHPSSGPMGEAAQTTHPRPPTERCALTLRRESGGDQR